MSNSRRYRRANVVSTLRDLAQFKDEYSKLERGYDYYISDTLKKALDSKYGRKAVFYIAKERIFVTVTEKTITDKITELLQRYNGKQ